ncbi:ABC transporter ATP-binding protein [Pseudoprimorskyibacter insulae]|uniref:Flagellar assembly protein FliH/Type III secretion system HrpE domain-containing protein n=1 Tax=Pseudoprimorskyibacter insulae TaxID=1695997 RepID=A0A2R8AYS1_9RHOB|nr:ABC transporter ATP-binding protein [Pseudoprimorskyibacter insulae]SPF81107.1 hypothetical protein PRI8871_02925 [Pseudoprimorskyibacter insulae]
MTALSNILTDFSKATWVNAEVPTIEPDYLENERLEAFEKGYKAGWEDVLAANSSDRERVAAEFSQNLLDLSFTYHEAHSHVLRSVMPLLDQMVTVLLPKVARQTIGAHVVENLQKMARDLTASEVQVTVHSENEARILPMMDQDFGFAISIQCDDSLELTQAEIRFGASEASINLDEILSAVRTAVEGFVYENTKGAVNG